MLKKIKNDLNDLGIVFDVFTSEEKIIQSGKLEETLNILSKKNLLYKGILEKPKGGFDDDWEEQATRII